MFYIVGLGNPGEQYANTRHNIGWLALDYVCKQAQLPEVVESRQYSGKKTEGVILGQSVTLLYPTTFMNNSGSAVAKLVTKEASERLVVIHDDIDLPFGEIKLGVGRGAGGNNGVQSIIDSLGTKNFIRIRIGIAPKSFFGGEIKRPKGGGPLERFVLKPLGKKELQQLEEVNKDIFSALQIILKEGIEAAMNKCN